VGNQSVEVGKTSDRLSGEGKKNNNNNNNNNNKERKNRKTNRVVQAHHGTLNGPCQ
jgi:hypothetical protein